MIPAAAVTDDGVSAPGYLSLLHGLQACGFATMGFAPRQQWRSYGTALGVDGFKPGEVSAIERRVISIGADQLAIDVFDLPPAAVSRIACQRLAVNSQRFCLVAGVNEGPNVGAGLIHSGTFGMALTAFWLGHSAVAASLDDVYAYPENEGGPLCYERAAKMSAHAASWCMRHPESLLINVNAPNLLSDGDVPLVPASPAGNRADGLISDIEALKAGCAAITVFSRRSLLPDGAMTKIAATEIALSMRS